MANEVAKTFGDKLLDQLTVVQTALPKDFNQARFVQNALSVINGNPMLQKCNKASIMEGLMKGAFLGLDFSNKECYLIPYGDKAEFQTDYKGEVKFVKKYSIRPIKDIYAEVIREKDDFSRTIENGEQKFIFVQHLPGGAIVGAFAVCLFEDNGLQLEVMSVEDIQSVRNCYSKASQSKAWKNSFDEMAKKVVLRRLTKHINTDFESVEAQQAWEDGSGMDFSNNGNIAHSEVVNPFKKETDAEDKNIIDGTATIINIEVPENFK